MKCVTRPRSQLGLTGKPRRGLEKPSPDCPGPLPKADGGFSALPLRVDPGAGPGLFCEDQKALGGATWYRLLPRAIALEIASLLMATRFANQARIWNHRCTQMHTDKRIAVYKAEKISHQAQDALNQSDFEHE
jgi:hypothetical protein